jgi:hypothetical protein
LVRSQPKSPSNQQNDFKRILVPRIAMNACGL